MTVFWIKFKALNSKTGRPFTANYETKYDTIEELVAALSTQPLVPATKLFYRKTDEPDVMEIIDTEERTLSLSKIDDISIPRYRFFRYED